jgi:hypothetical protein
MTRKQKIVDGILTVLIAPGALLVMLVIQDLFDAKGETKLALSILISMVFWFWILLMMIL